MANREKNCVALVHPKINIDLGQVKCYTEFNADENKDVKDLQSSQYHTLHKGPR